jgi:8-hydroxy-5-deazaflavin:NADPH oxidoreductase
MKIAIIGAGNVGGALGSRLAASDHEIFYGVPHPDDVKYAELVTSDNTSIAVPDEAAAQAQIILLATPWAAVQQAIESCGSLADKILVDCTNPIKADFSGLEVGHTISGAEMVAGWAQGAKVVKCFNQTGFENMANPSYDGQASIMFAAGDDEQAVNIVAMLAQDIGFEAVTLMGLEMARQLEQLAWLWIAMAYKQRKGRNFAFQLLHRRF